MFHLCLKVEDELKSKTILSHWPKRFRCVFPWQL